MAGKMFSKSKRVLSSSTAQHSVHPTGGSLRVFGQFAWLGVGSVKAALSHPTHPRVTQAVRQPKRFTQQVVMNQIKSALKHIRDESGLSHIEPSLRAEF